MYLKSVVTNMFDFPVVACSGKLSKQQTHITRAWISKMPTPKCDHVHWFQSISIAFSSIRHQIIPSTNTINRQKPHDGCIRGQKLVDCANVTTWYYCSEERHTHWNGVDLASSHFSLSLLTITRANLMK